MTTDSDASPLVGTVLDGRYNIMGRIARGGMATVYHAVDLRLERDVAIKIMHPHLAEDVEFIRRFYREARSAAKLTHPGVVSIFDQGSDDGVVYLSMELVVGKNVRQLLSELGALTPDEALDVAEQVLQALSAAHARDIVHRDIKPENILVTTEGQVKVADFGVARAASDTAATQAGTVFGTVAYLAPELLVDGEPTPAADVYAVGILLYEMLTGSQPFVGTALIQVAYQHVHDTVPAPSTRFTWLPSEIDFLVAALTAREPEERPRNAAAAATLLQQLRSDVDPELLTRRPPKAQTGPQGGAPTPERTELFSSDRTEVVSESMIRASAPQTGTSAIAKTMVQSLPATDEQPPEYEPVREVDTKEPRRNRKPLFIAIAAALAVLLALGGIVIWYFAAGPGAYAAVPEVANMTETKARSALQDVELNVKFTSDFSETVKKGTVIKTNPAAGASVHKGGTVTVVLSKGRQQFTLPKLTTLSQATATQKLDELALPAPVIKQAWSETVKAGIVMSQDPQPGTKVFSDVTVTLTVSKGRQPITIPNVRGMTQAAATKKLEASGFKVSAAQAYHETEPANTVISQSPAAENTGHKGDTVTVTVSLGPPIVTVPDVFRKNFQEAKTELEALGLKVQAKERFGGFMGEVRSQSIPAGDRVPKGTTIILEYV